MDLSGLSRHPFFPKKEMLGPPFQEIACVSRCFPKFMGKPGKEWLTEVLSRRLVAVGISSEGLGDTMTAWSARTEVAG